MNQALQCQCVIDLLFFLPQAHLERAYQEYIATKATDKTKQQESYYEHMVAVSQSEIACILGYL